MTAYKGCVLWNRFPYRLALSLFHCLVGLSVVPISSRPTFTALRLGCLIFILILTTSGRDMDRIHIGFPLRLHIGREPYLRLGDSLGW